MAHVPTPVVEQFKLVRLEAIALQLKNSHLSPGDRQVLVIEADSLLGDLFPSDDEG